MSSAAIDKQFMRLALSQARKGLGRTTPNPCVGAVIVKDGRIVGRGYHKKAGTPHAEVHALQQAGSAARGATMYVTLEPCSHTGRTGPCCQAVAAAGLARVVIGMLDPNPLVNGGGAAYLQQRGIEVVAGVREQECVELNRAFIKYITTGLPLVIMKAGVSLDGRISYQKGRPGAITSAQSLHQLHRLRDSIDAILVGIGTVRADDPSLTTRLPGGRGRDAVRLILDTRLHIEETAHLLHLDSAAQTVIFCAEGADQEKIQRLESLGAVVKPLATPGQRLDLRAVLQAVAAAGITSVLVEGGAEVHGAFLAAGLFDRAHLFYAPLFAGDGGSALVCGYNAKDHSRAVRLSGAKTRRCGEDFIVTGDVTYPA